MKKKIINNYINILTSIIIVISTIIALISALTNGLTGNMEGVNIEVFKYYTVLSNIYTGIISFITIPFFLYKIKNTDYKLPFNIERLRLSSTIIIFITFITVMVFLGPIYSYKEMIIRENFIMHVSTPLLMTLSYVFLDARNSLSFKKTLYSLTPLILYAILYMVMVVGIGEDNGGWNDFYHFNINGMWYITFIIFMVLGVILDFLFYKLNKLNLGTKDEGYYKVNYKYVIMSEEDKEYFNQTKVTAWDVYTEKVYKYICLLSPLAAIIAGSVFTLFKIVGWFSTVSTLTLIIFDISVLIYEAIAFLVVLNSYYENGRLIRGRIKYAKIAVALIIFIQWNFISFMIPSKDFWGYFFFFVLISAFFFDYKLTDIVSIELFVSIIFSWIIEGEFLAPTYDADFYPNLILRILSILLSALSLHVITYYGKNLLSRELDNANELDELTNLYNRNNISSYLELGYNEAFYLNESLSVAMIDIDDFTIIKEEYGDIIKNRVLRSVSEKINKSLSGEEKAFRYEEDEILVLFKKGIDDAYNILENLRKEINEIEIINSKSIKKKISITIGVTEFNKSKSIHELITRADELVLNGKNKGKNITLKDE